MSTYYDYRRVGVKIAHRLFKLDGWTVYGYHSDNSDPMTDYYDPAYWSGIAEKNGYKFVFNQSWEKEERRYTVPTSAQLKLDAETAAKIEKLERMTQEHGASPAEEATAKAKIEALRNKTVEATGEPATKEIIEPGHKANPPRCNWHIEKDGIIIDKGSGMLKFYGVPDITDERELKEWQRFNTKTPEEWKAEEAENERCRWNEDEKRAAEIAKSRYESAKEKYDLLEKFNLFINRINTTCGGMMGDATEFYTYKEVTKTEYKTEIKAQETQNGEMKEGQHIIIKSHYFNYGVCAGYVYVIHEKTNSKGGKYYTMNRMNGKNTKELTGTANTANSLGYFSNDRDMNRFYKWLENGSVAWCDLVEVKTPYEVKKVVKVKNSTAKKETAAEEATKPEATETETERYSIKADKDTRDNSDLWIVKIKADLSRSEFQEERIKMKKYGGYYSKFKHGFVFREDPTQKLTEAAPEESTKAEETTAEPKTEQPEADTTEEAAPDMFATFAAAYINKKTVKATKQKQEPPKEEPKAEEPEPAADPEPEPEPVKPGFYENSNSTLTPEQLEDMKNGKQVFVESEYGRRTYKTMFFTTPYNDSILLVYKMSYYGDGIQPQKSADYAGFIANGNLYFDGLKERIIEKLETDINNKLLELVPDLKASAHIAANVEKYEREQIERYIEREWTEEARKHFYNDKIPALFLYSGDSHTRNGYSAETIIKYISDPEKIVDQIALKYLCDHPCGIRCKWLEYSGTMKAYEDIKNDKTRIEHKIKKMHDSITEQKTVRVTLTNGAEIKIEASAIKGLFYRDYINGWDIAAADRDKVPCSSYGRAEDIPAENIKEIRHGGRILYKAS